MKIKHVALSLALMATGTADAHADRLVKGSDTQAPNSIFYYTNGDASGLAKEFLDFTVGPGGQKIVAQVGFVPIK